MTDSYFLDTNVLVYAHDSAHPSKQAKAQRLISEGLADDRLVLSAQVLSEFFVVTTQKIKIPLTAPKARAELDILRLARVIEIDADLVLAAVDERIHHRVSFWDGLILSAAHRAGCKTLYSEDLSHNQTFHGLQVVNPFA
jgi:predicted nucleic acid-binding protein